MFYQLAIQVIPNLQPGAVPSPPFPQMTNENSGNVPGIPGYYPVNINVIFILIIHNHTVLWHTQYHSICTYDFLFQPSSSQGPQPSTLHGGPTPPGFMPGQPVGEDLKLS